MEDLLRVGDKVKIPDIGPLATVVQSGRQMAKLELEGEQFWMSVNMVSVVEEVA